MTPDEIARALGGARRSGSNWSCRCPAHEDRHASLSVGTGRDGKILVHCHAGCEPREIIEHIKLMGLWPAPGSRFEPVSPVTINLPAAAASKGRIVGTYDYVDEAGELLYQAVRYEPKDFRQRAPLPGGGWSWSIKGVRRVLYRLPEVLDAVAKGDTIYIVEGEKDVETARSLGLVATCNAMGADNGTGNKWLPEFGLIFVNADIVIIPDQDDAGIRHAEWVISTVKGSARSVKVANPAVGKDLTDWVQAGATVADIAAAAVDAFAADDVQKLDGIGRGFSFLDVADLVADIKPIEWLVRDYLERDSLALIYGAPGGGKSFFAIDIAASVATGHEWLGNTVNQGAVFYIAGEGHNGLARRFRAWELEHKPIPRGVLYKSAGALAVLDETEVQEMVQVIESTGQVPAAVFIDTLARNFGAGDENSTEDMSKFIANLDRHIRQRWHCCVVIVHHSGHNMERARGSSALKAAVDAEYEISRDDAGAVRIRTTKMKDAELPPEMLLKLQGVELPGVVDEDGRPVTSAVLQIAGSMITAAIAERNDGSKITAADALHVLDRDWLSIRGLGEALTCSKRQSEKIMQALKNYGFTDGKSITDQGRAALSRTGHDLMQRGKPIWKRDQE